MTRGGVGRRPVPGESIMKTYECPIIGIDEVKSKCVICTSTFGDNDLFAGELDGPRQTTYTTDRDGFGPEVPL